MVKALNRPSEKHQENICVPARQYSVIFLFFVTETRGAMILPRYKLSRFTS